MSNHYESAEAEYRHLKESEHRALVVGGSSLAQAVALDLVQRGVPTAIVDDDSFDAVQLQADAFEQCGILHVLKGIEDAKLIEHAGQSLNGLSLLVNICLPDPSSNASSLLSIYQSLHDRCVEAADWMGSQGVGAIVNHCPLPVMYAGSQLEDHVSSLRGAVTGIVRTIARKYGRQNVRCVGVQTGMLELPEVHRWLHDAVKSVDVPVKRWGSAAECAKLISFCGVDASYITGQALIFDGGLTAGLSGT